MTPLRLPAAADSRVLAMRSDEEFLSRFGDVIDDRVAETLDELLEQRDAARRWRWPRLAAITSLTLAALAAGLLWRHNPIAWIIWPATTAASIAIARPAGHGRCAATCRIRGSLPSERVTQRTG